MTDPIQLIDLTEVGSGGNLISGPATACDLRKKDSPFVKHNNRKYNFEANDGSVVVIVTCSRIGSFVILFLSFITLHIIQRE